MNKYDERYFTRQVLGASTDFELDDPYVDDYDCDDDAMLPFGYEIVTDFEDEPLDGDSLSEEI